MALNIKDPVTERLAAEVAALTHDSKTGAIRVALQERMERLRATLPRQSRSDRLQTFLESEAWPQIPGGVRGQTISRKEWDDILGIGPEGV